MSKKRYVNYANRGMLFEKIIEDTNSYYYKNNVAVVRKIPTPIRVVGFDKNGLVKGFFEKKSALDFNGIIKGGLHIDFDTKETKSTTSFPFSNIGEHQMEYAREIDKFGGIVFFLLSIRNNSEVYLLRLKDIDDYLKLNPTKKSIPFSYIEEELKDNKVEPMFKNGTLMYDYLETLYKLI